MSILLIGAGYWGKNWAKTLRAIGELAGICDTVLSQENPEIYASLDDALAALPHVSGVVIATPPHTHRALACQALHSGLPVLVEKPLALTQDDAQAMAQCAQENNTWLAVGHLLLYHPALLQLKHWISDGTLGQILSVQCTRINLGQIRQVEDVWWSLAPHDLSILHHLIDEPLSLVWRQEQHLLGNPLADTVQAQYKTPSGIHAGIHVSWLAPHKRHETVVIGSKAMAVFEDTQPNAQKLFLQRYQTTPTLQKADREYATLDLGTDLLTRQAQAFLNKIANPTYAIPNDTQNALQVIHSLLQQT